MAKRLVVREPSARFETIGRVLVDSGPLLALFNRRDRWHAIVLAWLEHHPQTRLISTWPVATEVCALLARRIGNPAALDFLRWARRGGLAFDVPGEGSLADVLAICERFADLPFDPADASIAEAAQRLKIRQVLSLDADFDIYRDRSGKALVNVLHQARGSRPHRAHFHAQLDRCESGAAGLSALRRRAQA